jgi:hypothetical protein
LRRVLAEDVENPLHAAQNAGDRAIGQAGGQQGDHFAVQRIVIAEEKLEWIGMDEFRAVIAAEEVLQQTTHALGATTTRRPRGIHRAPPRNFWRR